MCVPVWVDVHHVNTDTCGGQKKALDLLELELQRVVDAANLNLDPLQE